MTLLHTNKIERMIIKGKTKVSIVKSSKIKVSIKMKEEAIQFRNF